MQFAVPRYRQIEGDLERDVRTGVLKPGERLPTEHEIGRRYGVSRITAQAAIKSLVTKGLVTRRPGRGTFVAQVTTERNLLSFLNLMLGEDEREIRVEGPHEDAAMREVRVGARDGQRLGIPGATVGVLLTRLKVDILGPTAVERTLFPFPEARELLDQHWPDLPVYGLLRQLPGMQPTRAQLHLLPHGLRTDEARALGQPRNRPTFLLERISYSGNHPVELSRFVIHPERQHLYMEYGD